MKYIFTAAALISLCGFASGATITGYNYIDEFSNPIVDSSGVAIPGDTGYVALGYFNVSDAVLQTYTTSTSINDAFVVGTSAVFGAGFGLAGTGLYSLTGSPSSTSFDGKTLYTLMCNASTINASTQFLIIKSTVTILADPAATPDAVVKNGAPGNIASVLVGNYSTFSVDLGIGGGSIPAYSMLGGFTPIPEPSAAILSMLGALGLVRRRRN
jgi:hypothetical protein